MNNNTDAEEEDDSYDAYIRSELRLPNSDGNPVWGTTLNRIRNNYGDPVGVVNHTPILNTNKYELQYMDYFMEDITANHITENMLFQVDSGGN